MNLPQINTTLSSYQTLGLKEINTLSLQKRVDTKYILNISEIPDILNTLKNSYQLVKIDGHEIQQYANIYFDTRTDQMFNHHTNEKLNRYKVRKRSYIKSNLSFLEIKFKNNKGQTIKCRTKTDNFTPILNQEEKSFILANSTLNPEKLEAQLFSDFHRITIVNFKTHERATFDLQLDYADMHSERTTFSGLAIIEVKQDKTSGKSKLIELLKTKNIRPSSFSKYCVVNIHLNKHLKYNKFKAILLHLHKINAYDVIS